MSPMVPAKSDTVKRAEKLNVVWFLSVPAVVVLTVVGGCSSQQELPTATVRGTVTFDGQPLPDGVIVFTKEGEVPRELPIVAGRYEGTVYVGQNHVQFAAYREKRQRFATGPGAEEASRENIIPSKYNQESTLTRQVQHGENQFDFQLESK